MSEYDYLIAKADRRTQAEAAALGVGGATAAGLGGASIIAPRRMRGRAAREATTATRIARASSNQGPMFIAHDMGGKGYHAATQQRGRAFRQALSTGDNAAYRSITTGLSDVNALRGAAQAGGNRVRVGAKAGKLARVLRRGSLGTAALTAAGAAGVGGYEANRRRRG
jgi:hypothetical protein